MSTVKDAQGNIVTHYPLAVINGKYTDERALVTDWFDHHPEDMPKEIVRLQALVRQADLSQAERGKVALRLTALQEREAAYRAAHQAK